MGNTNPLLEPLKTTEKLPPDTKAEWLAALRSGKYKQTIGYLKLVGIKDGPKYCCLGVLLDITREKFNGTWVPHEDTGIETFTCPTASGDSTYAITNLPEYVAESLGLYSRCMDEHRHATRCLTGMNDVAGSSFQEIADWIEKNL